MGTPLTFSMGFAGAYIWNLYDLTTRYRKVDLTPSAFHFSWIRMLAACIIGPLSSYIITPALATVVAFGFGLIPLQTVFEYFKQVASRKTNLTTQVAPAEQPTLHKLQGMTTSVIERLDEEGIDSAAALAYSDPLKIFIKTDFEWALITNFIDQALLFNYIGNKIELFRPLGILGAIDAATVYSRVEDGTPHDSTSERLDAENMIRCLAKILGTEESGAKNLLRTLKEDFQVGFIWSIFGSWSEGEEVHVEGHGLARLAPFPSGALPLPTGPMNLS